MNETVVRKDYPFHPGEEFLCAAVGTEGIAFQLKKLRQEKRLEGEVAGSKVTAIWDEELDAARIAEPFAGLWTRCYWYAWISFYPDTAIIGEPEEEE